MNLKVKEQVKSLLAQEDIKLKDLARILSEKTTKTYSPDSLSQKLRRGSLSYNEVSTIADILGYNIKFEKYS